MKIYLQINDGGPIEWQQIEGAPVQIAVPDEQKLKEHLATGGKYFILHMTDINGNTLKIYPEL